MAAVLFGPIMTYRGPLPRQELCSSHSDPFGTIKHNYIHHDWTRYIKEARVLARRCQASQEDPS